MSLARTADSYYDFDVIDSRAPRRGTVAICVIARSSLCRRGRRLTHRPRRMRSQDDASLGSSI
jgi:hypothetical protein